MFTNSLCLWNRHGEEPFGNCYDFFWFLQDPELFDGSVSVRNFAAPSTLWTSNLLFWYGLSQEYFCWGLQGVGELLVPLKNRFTALLSEHDPTLLFQRKVRGSVWLLEWVSGRRTGVLEPPKPPGVAPPDSNRILPVVDEFPPDSNRILHRLTLPVTTGDGDLLRMDKGVTRVEGGFEGVPLRGLKWLNFLNDVVECSVPNIISPSNLYSCL